MQLSPLELIAHAAIQDAKDSIHFRFNADSEFHSQPRRMWLLAQEAAEDAVIAAAETITLYSRSHPVTCNC